MAGLQLVSFSGVVAGGPESLHNLVRVARALGHDAEIVYYPFDRPAATPAPYLEFEAPIGRLRDEKNNLIIFPETLPMEALKIRFAIPAIWWLSVDNFFCRKYGGLRDHVRYWSRVLQKKRPARGLRALSHIQHFSKARYDREVLDEFSFAYKNLCSPINDLYISQRNPSRDKPREDIILYNPKKDHHIAEGLARKHKNLTFVPLQGLNRTQLHRTYHRAKVYIDFGRHPGKERMPREAAVSGCCIITGMRGSAANDEDVPIPRQYKHDIDAPDAFDRIAQQIMSIFQNYERHSLDFEHYRTEIIEEPMKQVRDLSSLLSTY